MVHCWADAGSFASVFTVHGTKTFLDRCKQPAVQPVVPSTVFGNWYATVVLWRPQIALFVNAQTFLPVFVPLAPASRVLTRFPPVMADVLDRIGIDPRVVANEVTEMGVVSVAKTADRQVLGVMKELIFMADAAVDHGFDPADVVGLSVSIAGRLIGPLYKPKGGPGNPAEAARRHAAFVLPT